MKYFKLTPEQEKHLDGVDWGAINRYQRLSEAFIERHAERVDWWAISLYQRLSEAFIERHAERVDWGAISRSQRLSEAFIERHAERVDAVIQRKKHAKKTGKQKLSEIKEYAKLRSLKFSRGYLYAFREHDHAGRGRYSGAIFYQPGKTYRDWHCDMDASDENSFGLGISPQGNTAIRVHYRDWGVAVNRKDGKARVWAFTVLEEEQS